MGTNAGEDITAKLDAAIEEAVETESPTVETEVEKPEDKKGTSPEGKKATVKAVPYTRFKEVNDEKKTLQDSFEELQAKYAETNDSLAKMTKMLDAVKSDADLLKDIRALANDPKMLPHIEALDKRIKGIEDEIEETGGATDKTVDKAQQILAREQEKLQEEIASQRSEILLTKADAIAEKWLQALPEQYTEEDRNIIAELWANKVDWEEVEENPKSLMEVLNQTFQSTVTAFGRPRGGLIDPEDPDTYEIEEVDKETPTPEQELQELIKGRNFGALKETKQGNKTILTPEVSEDDFAAILATAMKRGSR